MGDEFKSDFGRVVERSPTVVARRLEHRKQHFGEETWKVINEAKKRFDPEGILNPGFIRSERRASR